MAQVNTDLQKYETFDDDFGTPIPEGEYEVEVLNSEVKRSNAGNLMIKYTFAVIGPTHASRRLWDQFMLNSEVALRRLKTLATVSGHRNPNFIKDTDELHGLRCRVRVEIERQEGYSPKNVIKSYKALDGASRPTNPAPTPATPARRPPVPPPLVPPPPVPPPLVPPVPADTSKKSTPAYPWEK